MDIEKRELYINTWTVYLKYVKSLKKVIINEVEANLPAMISILGLLSGLSYIIQANIP